MWIGTIKNCNCILDGRGHYDSNLVSFRRKTLEQTNFLVQLTRVFKKYELLVKKEIPKQKFQVLSDFELKILQRVGFWNRNFTTRQILK